ncbi:MAG: threonine/serine exporter family protein [Clostridiales Family XIII bacterium]|nr:threonine/serine exporter family protein [Clostridiales Family XIII bacterium]
MILALYAGELMMKSGAEIYRVEDTIERICRVCKVDYVECFATTTGIFLSLDSEAADSDMHTFIKRINGTSINLDRISKLNHFSRVFVSTDLSVEDGFQQLRSIAAEKVYAFWLRVIGAVLVGVFMSPYYGADVLGMAFAGIAAGIGYMVSIAVSKLNFAKFIQIFIGCAVCALTALPLLAIWHDFNTTPVILGAITVFMPGVAITNSARDLLSGDMLTGVARMFEAIVIAIGIAGGTATVITVWTRSGGSISQGAVTHPLALFPLYGALLTLGFCLLFHSPARQIIVTSIIGGVGMLALVALPLIGGNSVSAVFFGTCIVAVLAEFASRAGKDATTVFILPGIIPFVPGAAIYETMAELLGKGVYPAAIKGVETFIGAGCIAVALILIASLTRILIATIGNVKKLFTKERSY